MSAPSIAASASAHDPDRPDSGAVNGARHAGSVSIAVQSPTKGPASPLINDNLKIGDHQSKSGKKSKKGRAMSNSSAMSAASSSIVAALAKSGLHIASPTSGEGLLSSAQSSHSKSNRSPFLVRGNGAEDPSISNTVGSDEAYDDEDDEDEEDTESEGDDHLPVTGFAVASNKRQADFHSMFSSVDEGDYLIEGACRSKPDRTLADALQQIMDVHWQRRSWCKDGCLCRRITCASTQTSLDGLQM